MSMMVAAGETLSVRNVRRPKATALRRRVKAEVIDRDVQEFCAKSRTLVPSAAGRRQLSRFVAGVKSLGLWGNGVLFPLPQGRRCVSGNTVFSLGGMGAANGTRSNGRLNPTGFFTGSAGEDTGVITASIPGKASFLDFHVIYVTRKTSISPSNQRHVDLGEIELREKSGNTGDLFLSDGTVEAQHIGLEANRHQIYQAGNSAGTFYIQSESVARATAATSVATFSNENMWLSRDSNNGNQYLGTTSFFGILNLSRTDAQAKQLEKLLRDTLLEDLV